MKTDQLMIVTIDDFKLEILHKSHMGNLTQLWNYGSALRGKPSNISLFLNSNSTKAFIDATASVTGIDAGDLVKIVGKGNKKATYAHINVLIYAAEYLSPLFHAKVIDTFVNDRILQWRDDSGDEFKLLNYYVDSHLPNRNGMNNKGIYITIAKIIRNGILGENHPGWNNATANELLKRYETEHRLADYLQMGFVKDWSHLKEIVEKIVK